MLFPQPFPLCVEKVIIIFFRQVIFFEKCIHNMWHFSQPYCVSRLIQFLNGYYRFYIYRKCPKINTFRNGSCTRAWAAIVLLVEIAALSIFLSVNFNDSLFFGGAIVIFCIQRFLHFFVFNQPNFIQSVFSIIVLYLLFYFQIQSIPYIHNFQIYLNKNKNKVSL